MGQVDCHAYLLKPKQPLGTWENPKVKSDTVHLVRGSNEEPSKPPYKAAVPNLAIWNLAGWLPGVLVEAA